MALMNGVIALGFWHLRANMRMVRWAIVASLLEPERTDERPGLLLDCQI